MAQCNLGLIYCNGEGVNVDYTEAMRWFLMAVEQEYLKAYYNIGKMYEKAYGVKKDLDTASEWYQKAADKGCKDAQSALERLEQLLHKTADCG